MSAPVRFDQLDPARQAAISANITKMRGAGAPDADVEQYLTQHERLAPAVPITPPGRIRSFTSEGTATAPDQAGRRAAAAAEPAILSSGLPRELEQGATLGFGDEINAGARAVFTKDSYAEALANERMIQHAYEQAHPIVSLGAQLAGGAALGGASGAFRAVPAAANVSRFGQAARIVGSGAGIGAVAGAGNAEGDLSDRVTGAERGAVAGAIAAPIVAGAGALTRKVVGSAVSRGLDYAGARAPAAPVAPMLDDRAGIELTLPQRAARRVGVRSAQDRGDQVVLNTITKGGQSIDDLRQAATGASSDKPITLADIGGEGAQQLVAGARGNPATAAATRVPRIIRGRAATSGERMSADMTSASGLAPVNPYELADQMTEARRTQANQLYADAYSKGAVPDETIDSMLKLPYFKEAYGFAKNLAKLEGRQLPERITQLVEKGEVPPTPPGFSDEQWAKMRATQPNNPTLNPPDKITDQAHTVPDVEALDMVKRGIDAQIEKNVGKNSIDKSAAVKLKQRLDEFLTHVDAKVPEYGRARAAYSESSRMLDALEAGRGAVQKDPLLIEREIAALKSPHEQGLYRYGLQHELNNGIQEIKDGGPVASRLTGSSNAQQRVAQIAKDAPSAQELLKRAGEERAMDDVNARVLGGSNTAEKLGARQEIDAAGTGTKVESPTLNPAKLAVRAIRPRLMNILNKVNANTADAVANRLMAGTTNRQELLDALDQLETFQKKGQLTSAKTRELLKLPASEQAARLVAPSRYK